LIFIINGVTYNLTGNDYIFNEYDTCVTTLTDGIKGIYIFEVKLYHLNFYF